MGYKLSLLFPFYFTLLSCQFAQMSFTGLGITEEFLFSLKSVIKFSLKWVTSCHSYVRFISLFCPVNSLKCLSPVSIVHSVLSPSLMTGTINQWYCIPIYKMLPRRVRLIYTNFCFLFCFTSWLSVRSIYFANKLN